MTLAPRPLPKAKVLEQWAGIDARLDAADRSRRRRPALVAGGAFTLAIAAAALFWVSRPAAPLAGATFVTTEHPQRVALADGSSIVVAPESRVRPCDGSSACFVVEQGGAEFEVTPRGDGAPFVVRAGDVSVTVVGTRFTVTERERDGRSETTVEVAHGVVEVRVGDGTARRLGAGERFVMAFGEPGPEPVTAPETPASEATPAPETPAPTEPETTSARERISHPGGPRGDGAHEDEGEPGEDGPSGADRLFAEARAARAADDLDEAARRYAALLDAYPRDPRAGLAAFELGRLRMDSLHDPRGAIAPLTRALESASHREDALARLARAHDALGDRARCAEARERYLREFEGGAHAAAVRALCP